jgi:putative flippase GtrA
VNQKLKSFFQRPAYRYITVGVSVYLYEILVIIIAQHYGASPVEAVAISFWSALLVSFGLQKLVTFSDKRLHHKILLGQFIAFSFLVLFNFCFTVLITKLLSSVAPPTITRTLALGITTIWNFYLYKTHIFKGSNPL